MKKVSKFEVVQEHEKLKTFNTNPDFDFKSLEKKVLETESFSCILSTKLLPILDAFGQISFIGSEPKYQNTERSSRHTMYKQRARHQEKSLHIAH